MKRSVETKGKVDLSTRKAVRAALAAGAAVGGKTYVCQFPLVLHTACCDIVISDSGRNVEIRELPR